jgi:hypothetical protein
MSSVRFSLRELARRASQRVKSVAMSIVVP